MSKITPADLALNLVQDAESVLGHCYFFGGAPGLDGTRCWDCSSCQNWIYGKLNGLSIPDWPNGTYDGSEHGPSTIGWLDAQGTIVGSVPRGEAQAGDLAVWQTHMGMCISSEEMISAANPTDGTIKSGIDGFIPGEQLFILRHNAIGTGGITLPTIPIGNTTKLMRLARDIAYDTKRDVATLEQVRRIGRKEFRPR